MESNQKVIALAGNPNVGKSTVFNELTGLKQHTGNWPGKTVDLAWGKIKENDGYIIVDLPGCYSLMAHSKEEEVARDFICFEKPDTVIVVCDAVCIERNMNLVLQVLEAASNVVVCINLLDEARKKKIHIDFESLSSKLSANVIGISARKKEGIDKVYKSIARSGKVSPKNKISIRYKAYIEEAIDMLEDIVKNKFSDKINSRWLSVRLLDADESLRNSILKYTEVDIFEDAEIMCALKEIESNLKLLKISKQMLKDDIAEAVVNEAKSVCEGAVYFENKEYNLKEKRLDKIFTGKVLGFPIMFIGLMLIFWITISGANYPSNVLSFLLFKFEDILVDLSKYIGIPAIIYEVLIFGVYRVVAWVVSVMLPPMAIFFPLFTILEDSGYLPRVAFNLDKGFKKCNACGKQALTMCMGRIYLY